MPSRARWLSDSSDLACSWGRSRSGWSVSVVTEGRVQRRLGYEQLFDSAESPPSLAAIGEPTAGLSFRGRMGRIAH
jgi:hypothetical protein